MVQTLAEDELRSGTPAESLAEGSELNESFIFQSEKNGKIVGHRQQSQKGLNYLYFGAIQIIRDTFLALF